MVGVRMAEGRQAMATETQPPDIRTEHPYVTRRPGVCGGAPIVGGRRIPVWQIAYDLQHRGMSAEEIASEFEGRISPAAVYDAISYYYDHRDEIDHQIWQNVSEEALERQLAQLDAYRDDRGAIRFRRSPSRQRPDKLRANTMQASSMPAALPSVSC